MRRAAQNKRWEKDAGYIQLMGNGALLVKTIRHCYIWRRRRCDGSRGNGDSHIILCVHSPRTAASDICLSAFRISSLKWIQKQIVGRQWGNNRVDGDDYFARSFNEMKTSEYCLEEWDSSIPLPLGRGHCWIQCQISQFPIHNTTRCISIATSSSPPALEWHVWICIALTVVWVSQRTFIFTVIECGHCHSY